MQVARKEIEYLRAYANLDTSFEAHANTTDDAHLDTSFDDQSNSTIKTVATLAEKATESEGATFIVTVKPKDFPECWGIRMNEIHLPSSVIDFEAIKKEVMERGVTNRRGVFLRKDGKRKQLRCTLVPKY